MILPLTSLHKIDEALHWASQRTSLIAIGTNSFVADFENWKANAIYFFDNNRNIVEFISRSDLNNAIDKSFQLTPS